MAVNTAQTPAVRKAAAAQQATPLFASDQPLRIEIRGPISQLAKGPRSDRSARPGQLTVIGSGGPQAIRLTPRGITRLRKETCTFPPLRVEFAPSPGQSRIPTGGPVCTPP